MNLKRQMKKLIEYNSEDTFYFDVDEEETPQIPRTPQFAEQPQRRKAESCIKSEQVEKPKAQPAVTTKQLTEKLKKNEIREEVKPKRFNDKEALKKKSIELLEKCMRGERLTAYEILLVERTLSPVPNRKDKKEPN